MFENWIPGANERAAMESEKRQLSFAREQTAISASVADQMMMEEQNSRSDLIRWQQELSSELEQLKRDLRNQTIDEKGNLSQKTKVIQGKVSLLEPMMTEEGINMVETELRPLLSKNLINSNLDEDRILEMLRNTANTITDNIASGYDMYVLLHTPDNMSHIMRLIKNAMIPTPFRALNGWTKKQDSTAIRRVETFNDGAPAERKKVLGVI